MKTLSPSKQAHHTGRWAETMMKVFARHAEKRRWQLVSFRGPSGGESRGIVDVLAIRKDHQRQPDPPLKRGDLFEIIVVQLKGGRAPRPSMDDRERLRKVARTYGAQCVVLFEWKRRERATFSVLNKRLEWEETTATNLFG